MKLKTYKRGWILSLSAASLLVGAAYAAEVDWPQFQGPQRNNTTSESGWKKDWPADGPPVLWKAEVGSGMASFAVVGHQVFTAGNDGSNKDTVWCLDLDTGKPLWSYSYACKTAAHEMPIVPPGPCSTVSVEHDHVFTISREGDVLCLDAKTGALIWKKSLIEDFHGKRPVYGYASSPLVVGDRLFLDAGGSTGSTVCLKAATGDLLWAAGSGEAGYASPFLAHFHDQDLLIAFKGQALEILDPQDGKERAHYDTTTNDFCNTATPALTNGGHLLISHTGSDGATGLEYNGAEITKSWNLRDLGMLFNSGVPWGNHGLIVFNDQMRGVNDLRCLDVVTGQSLWQSSEIDKGEAILSDGHLLVLSAKGELFLAKPSDAGITVLSRAQVLGGKCWALPVISHYRILCRSNAGAVVCLDVR